MTDKEFNERLGAILRAERKRRDWSLQYVAERVGVSSAAVHYWETGKKTLSALSLSRYCDVLGVSIDYIFNRVKGV